MVKSKAKQKKSKNPLIDLLKQNNLLRDLFKKGSVWGIILLLASSLIQLVSSISLPEPVELPSSDHPVELYSNQTQDNLSTLYEKAIENSQHSIVLSIYSLMDDKIVRALQKKADEKVPIFIVCDAKASPGITKKLPNATLIRRTGLGLMHQKILVVDNHQILLGSANLTYSSLNVHGNLVIGLDSPYLASVLSERIKSMDEDQSPLPELHKKMLADKQTVELWVLPNETAGVKRMTELFRSAQKTIQVAMFTWTRLDFAEELVAASKRGVKVEVVLDRYSGKGASSKVFKFLQDAGIDIRLSSCKGLLHHKFAYIDKNILANGSANFTHSAFKNNDDDFMLIYPLAQSQRNKMDRLWTSIKKQTSSPEHVINH